MQNELAAIAANDEIESVCDQFLQGAKRLGAWCQSYHITPRFARQNSPHIQMISRGIPKSFRKLYNDPNFRSLDPIPDYIVEVGRTMTWQDVIAEIRDSGLATPENEQYFTAIVEHGFVHGIAVPLYGPNHRNGFTAFALDDLPVLDGPQVKSLEALSQVAHRRISELVDQADKHSVNLSEREQQVLEKIALGCSNIEIAKRLGISPETVQTYVKRLFDKLDTRDRIGATVKGLKLGLIYA